MLLGRRCFLYTETFQDKDAFGHRSFFARERFYSNPPECCTYRSFFTQTLLHAKAFRQIIFEYRIFCTQKYLHRSFLDADAFVLSSFYKQEPFAKKLLHAEALCAFFLHLQIFLHTEGFGHRSFFAKKLQVFIHKHFYTRKL